MKLGLTAGTINDQPNDHKQASVVFFCGACMSFLVSAQLTGSKPVRLSTSRAGVSEFVTKDARAAFVGIFVWCILLKANKQP